MRIVECDRCHQRIDPEEKIGYVSTDKQGVRT